MLRQGSQANGELWAKLESRLRSNATAMRRTAILALALQIAYETHADEISGWSLHPSTSEWRRERLRLERNNPALVPLFKEFKSSADAFGVVPVVEVLNPSAVVRSICRRLTLGATRPPRITPDRFVAVCRRIAKGTGAILRQHLDEYCPNRRACRAIKDACRDILTGIGTGEIDNLCAARDGAQVDRWCTPIWFLDFEAAIPGRFLCAKITGKKAWVGADKEEPRANFAEIEENWQELAICQPPSDAPQEIRRLAEEGSAWAMLLRDTGRRRHALRDLESVSSDTLPIVVQHENLIGAGKKEHETWTLILIGPNAPGERVHEVFDRLKGLWPKPKGRPTTVDYAQTVDAVLQGGASGLVRLMSRLASDPARSAQSIANWRSTIAKIRRKAAELQPVPPSKRRYEIDRGVRMADGDPD